ncbi:hypothetical protein O4H53_26340 [Sulfitobacter sp. G21635-S1]|uniref:hypothetical protein n=1 Tax=Sulfitobacter sp. G21635-S1 TaxID=3014043 RepID=UPI0022AF7C5A|nr:hypothetical protein [Sulfitobacter sp. G21635-S1]MCZ4259075.1 hypothetical protein [Sulfitobacter sp. G21635-S1]
MPLYFSTVMNPNAGTTSLTKSPTRHAKGMPMINDAPSVRRAGRRWPGAFGLFRAWVLMFDGSNVRSAAIRQLVDEGPRSK